MKGNLEKEVGQRSKAISCLLPVFYSYLEKRECALSGLDEGELKEKLRELKKMSIENISELKKKAIKNLTENGIKVIEAKNPQQAQKAILKILGGEKLLVKSKSNAFKELGLEKALGGVEVVETDLGDFLVQVAHLEGIHPVLPALKLTPKDISKAIKEKYGVSVKPEPAEIASFARNKLREKIAEARVGLTGANAITADGSVMVLENEGNISLVSRFPEKHIIVAGFEKIIPTVEDALLVAKCSAVYGTGQKFPVYVSLISGPSKTADIQNKVITGAQGAKEVYLILLDNGRSGILGTPYEEILYCINCGACLNLCPIYHQIQNLFGNRYAGAKGVVFSKFSEGLQKSLEGGAFYCTGCSSCRHNCPAKIDLPELVRLVRGELVKKGLAPEGTKKTIENLQKYSSAIGKVGEDAGSDWQCC
ncbi:MAG: lactate utilization protein [Candidatus Aenigmarchaeota archaeon]|nr:lactate utilization protein [Candidatus Aenigmarchaeota archaeon]